MGVVYRAVDTTLDRQVAIKVIQTTRLERAEQLSRFTTEAKALAQLSSPHVVAVFDYNPDPTGPYLVMEYVQGRSLAAVLREDGALPIRKLVDCAWQVLSGLTAAHAAGILHRDIKPGNILLALNGVYKLADFGLAMAGSSAEDLTNTGEIVGTVRYLAPERAAGADATKSSDLYGLGVSLYELACGRHPIKKEDNALAIAHRIVREPLPPIRQNLPNIPPTLAVWFDRLVAHNPDQRFSSASEALAALEVIDIGNQGNLSVTTRRMAKGNEAETGSTQKPQIVTAGQGEGTVTAITGRPMVTATNRPPSTAINMSATRLRPVPEQLKRKPRTRFVVKLIIVIWLVSSGATFFAGLMISHQAIAEQSQHFRNEMTNTAAAAALFVDGAVHQRLAAAGAQASDDPDFHVLVKSLQRYQATHPDVTYIYTMAKLPDSDQSGIVQFVCDASQEIDRNRNGIIDPDEVIANPGKRYDASMSPQLTEGFLKPSADKAFVKDQWGWWLSGYAPIRDQHGKVTGLVGVDLAAAHITQLERDFLFHSLVLLGSTLVAFLAAGFIVAMRMRRPILALHEGMLKVASGNLDVTIQVNSADEFKVLADSFNYMLTELRDAAAIRRAFEGFVAHAIATQGPRFGASNEGFRARLYCELDQSQGALIDRQALTVTLGQVLPLLFDAVRLHDGLPDRVLGTGVVVSFAATHPNDKPQERAVRAALVFLAALEGVKIGTKLTVGIDVGDDAAAVERCAVALCNMNQRLGTDLLVSVNAFLPIRNGFYADRLTMDGSDANLPQESYAVKGAVSAAV